MFCGLFLVEMPFDSVNVPFDWWLSCRMSERLSLFGEPVNTSTKCCAAGARSEGGIPYWSSSGVL